MDRSIERRHGGSQMHWGRLIPLLFALLLSFPSLPIYAATSSVVVIYPEARGPYQKVFSSIILGIEQRVMVSGQYKLPRKYELEDLAKWLKENPADSIIALGQRGVNATKRLKSDIPYISGAHLITDGEGVSGISLTADVERLFAQLKKIAPKVKRVVVLYNPNRFSWLHRLSEQASAKFGLKLRAYPVSSLREAAVVYGDILDRIQSDTDAIWIMRDAINGKSIISMLLKAAWQKKLILFSSVPSHAKKGVLFSASPDYFKLGVSLAEMALSQNKIKGRRPLVIEPVKELNMSLNRRTAAHLSLDISDHMDDFKWIFPAR
ncbi:MAG: ABC transporter substrate-binding protein [Gammaproteobacteria bacterium]|nr:ABC transporter substrate-binding protein [Gammaproteobacteria bacterium]